jgi:hypothetical protein
MAKLVSFSRPTLGNVETGQFQPSLELAAACDAALGTSPLLVTLLQIEKGGDDVNRRALMGTATAVGAGALFATMDGTAAMAAMLDAGLRGAAGEPTDWDTLAADFARRHVLSPSAELGNELAAQLAVARDRVAAGDRDAARGAASLAMTYALWLGDVGRVPTAAGLHATSALLADRSGHTHTRAMVRARAANRGIYEGWTARRAQAGITEALAITSRGTAALEAHAGAVHIAGLTGDLTGGLRALDSMRTVADQLPAGDSPTPQQRVASFAMYLHGRIGTLPEATKAYDTAERVLADVPLWRADGQVYMARALVRSGAVDEGAALALDAVRSLQSPVRVLGWGVRDVLAAAPKGGRNEGLAQLRMYASTGPAPWETLH